MIKKILFLTCIILSNFSSLVNSSTIKIVAEINNEILTNHDVIKEYRYLELLNPSQISLNDLQKFDLAKKSLISQTIKINEIKKAFDLNEKNEKFIEYFNEYFQKEFLRKINVKNIENLNKKLLANNTYSLKEVKEKIMMELYWNELIFLRFKDKVSVDKNKIISEVRNLKDAKIKEYYLSEILFKKTKDATIENLIKEITTSIKEIGFSNSANIYSISDTSKYGGKIGWVSENSLSNSIKLKLNQTIEGGITDFFKVGNNYLILKIEKIRTKKSIINEKVEVENLIKQETNKQLNTYSKIYFEKVKMNYSINER